MYSRAIRISLRCSRRATFTTRIRPTRRHATTNAQATAGSQPVPDTASSYTILRELTDDLETLTPHFDVTADQISILKTPAEFHDTLKSKILEAKHHVFLSTLYIGRDAEELVATIRQALDKNPDLNVAILVDALRATRESPYPSCSSLIATLVVDYPGRVRGYLFRTPNMMGPVKSCIPKRINEGWGLQHMKLYGIDNEIIISGANLSKDYFTNRQDRYHLISSAEVTLYYWRIFRSVCAFSLAFKQDPKDPRCCLFDDTEHKRFGGKKGYKLNASELFVSLIRKQGASKGVEPQKPVRRNTDTRIYPLFQLTPIMQYDVSTELPAIKLILLWLASPACNGSSWMFTAGYFNMSPDIRNRLLATKPKQGVVVAASPWANGFYGSAGISGMLPAAYTHLAKSFLSTVSRRGLADTIKLKEWRLGTVNTPGGWTYHAKGFWVTLPNETQPSITLIGSSNYTKRSHSLDLEANALIVTTNPDLKRRLAEEQAWLQEHASEVSPETFRTTERRVGLHVRLAMWIVTLVGGAL